MKKILLILLLIFIYNKGHSLSGFTPEQNKSIHQFIKTFSKKNKLDPKKIEAEFSKVSLNKSVIKLITHPHEALPWYKYKKIFIEESRIQEGVEFWKKNQTTLEKAEKKYGVPAEVIIAIMGIETKYGARQGNFHVLEALTTLGFAYPPRAKFFKKELGQFLLLCKEQRFEPYALKGSYAGAIGQPQFMPSSYRNFAVDFDHSGKSDLMHNNSDTIGSIANYLKKNGWKGNEPLVYKASVINNKHRKLKQKSTKPKFSAKSLRKYGVRTNQKLSRRSRYIWLPLDISDKKQDYWVASHNFYVITRYNTSKLYAMAAVELSQAIKARMTNSKS